MVSFANIKISNFSPGLACVQNLVTFGVCSRNPKRLLFCQKNNNPYNFKRASRCFSARALIIKAASSDDRA